MARQKCLVGGHLEGRVGLALPPPDREPSRFAAPGQAPKDRPVAIPLIGPTCCGRGTVRGPGGNFEMRQVG